MSVPEPLAFEALIVPYRSLTRKGMRNVVGIMTALTAAVAFRFWLWGAWPVVAFSLLEVPLLVLLLAINQRRARASELIMLDARQLTVIRTDPAGIREQYALPAAWLRINLESAHGMSRVVLRSHGRNCEVGAFLHEPDKLSLFNALADALYRSKNPSFNNPRLREESSAYC